MKQINTLFHFTHFSQNTCNVQKSNAQVLHVDIPVRHRNFTALVPLHVEHVILPQNAKASHDHNTTTLHLAHFPKTTLNTSRMDKIKQFFHKDNKDSSSGGSTAAAPKSGGNPDGAKVVILHTTFGDITIDLYGKETPRVSISLMDIEMNALT